MLKMHINLLCFILTFQAHRANKHTKMGVIGQGPVTTNFTTFDIQHNDRDIQGFNCVVNSHKQNKDFIPT